MRVLKDKTILYVTHQVEFLPAADLILVCRKTEFQFVPLMHLLMSFILIKHLHNL